MYREKWGKYNSKRQECQKGHWHHSKFEAGKCDELRLREIAHDIASYEIQKRVDLKMDGVYMGKCYIDFYITHNNGTFEYLETKGAQLRREFRFKRNWAIMEHMFKDSPDIFMTLEVQK